MAVELLTEIREDTVKYHITSFLQPRSSFPAKTINNLLKVPVLCERMSITFWQLLPSP
jgi:hypothetical protein